MAEPGQVLGGRYRLDQRLGAGGFGEVWLAFDQDLERGVAVKLLLGAQAGDAQALRLFEREAKLAAQLAHPGITSVFDYKSGGAQPYLVMELLRGEDLNSRLRNSPEGLPIAKVVEWCAQAAEALAEAHDAGVVHRDIKPANLMLLARGRIKVCDFGIARAAGATGSVTAGNRASLHYAAPEQLCQEPVDGRTDLYALGCTLYKLLTGNPPFTGDAKAIIAGHIGRSPASPRSQRPDIPADLDALILRLLAKDPDERPSDAAETANQLCEAVREPDPPPRPAPRAGEAELGSPLAEAPVAEPLPAPASDHTQLSAQPPEGASPRGTESVFDDALLIIRRLRSMQSEAKKGEMQALLARRDPARRADLSDGYRVAGLLASLNSVGAEEQVATLLARDPARHAKLSDGIKVAELMKVLRQLGAQEQVEALLARAPERHVDLSNVYHVDWLLEAFQRVGAQVQVQALLARDPARHIDLGDGTWVARFLTTLRSIGAEEQVAALLARDPARHIDPSNTSYVAWLLEAFERVGAQQQVDALLARDPARHADLSNGYDVARLLEALRGLGAEEQLAALLARDPARHADVPGPGVRMLLEAFERVGAEEQLAALRDRLGPRFGPPPVPPFLRGTAASAVLPPEPQ